MLTTRGQKVRKQRRKLQPKMVQKRGKGKNKEHLSQVKLLINYALFTDLLFAVRANWNYSIRVKECNFVL